MNNKEIALEILKVMYGGSKCLLNFTPRKNRFESYKEIYEYLGSIDRLEALKGNIDYVLKTQKKKP